MAVTLIVESQRFVGLSSDTKPTDATVKAGASFIETDTGASYAYDLTSWTLRPIGAPLTVTKTITFTGAANLGAIGAVPMFTITGRVMVRSLHGYVTVNLAGVAATISLGVTGTLAGFIVATTATTMLTTAPWWVSATPTANLIALPAALQNILIDQNILATVAVAAITAGSIVMTVAYDPQTANGKLA